MGQLFTTSDGEIIKDIPAGDVQLDFMAGTVTDSAGTVTNMNSNLNTYNLHQCKSIAIWTSDADSEVTVGTGLVVADHQLTHVINQYAFSNVRVTIPSNSTPDENQLGFVASTDDWLGYIFNNYAHDRDTASGTTTNAQVVYFSKHTGAYDTVNLTMANTHGSNSMDVVVEFSEDGTNWFEDQGYTTPVIVTNGSYNAYSDTKQHHFYRVQLNSTSAGNHATFVIYYNLVSANN